MGDLEVTQPSEALQEAIGGGDCNIELKNSQNITLHIEDILFAVSSVCDVSEVLYLRRVDLLVLGGDQHGRDAHQL